MVYHEVLLAMLGHTGGLLVCTDGKLKVRDEFDFLMPHERCLVERVAQTGHTFAEIEAFIRRVRTASRKENGVVRESLYMRALVAGLEEILDVFRAMVLSVEQAVLAEPSLPLTYLVTRVGEFELLLPALHKLCREAEGYSGDAMDAAATVQHPPRGCKLLDLISSHACRFENSNSITISRESYMRLTSVPILCVMDIDGISQRHQIIFLCHFITLLPTYQQQKSRLVWMLHARLTRLSLLNSGIPSARACCLRILARMNLVTS
jgi:hypothetical protein